MSKLTRRDFLKTAGVMTLAVAAAGVLSGCEGKVDPEKPIVTGNSVTVGDYTLTIKEAKQFSVKTYEKGDGSSATNELASEKRYVVVLGNLMNNDEAAKTLPAFNLAFDNKGVNEDTTVVYKDCVEKQFNLTVEPIKWLANRNFLEGKSAAFVKNATPNGTPVFWAYEVKSKSYADKTVVFETPVIKFVARDDENKVYTKIDVAIPAATDITADALQGK